MADTMTAPDLIHRIARTTRARRFVALSSDSTGIPALGAIEPHAFEVLISMRYSAAGSNAPSTKAFRDIAAVITDLCALGPFDLAFVDPFDSYRESLAALQGLLPCLHRSGWLVVHDCLPPPDLSGEQYVDGPWCGSTYAAFRDVAVSSGRGWFVVDADYGLGVMTPEGTNHLVSRASPARLDTRWALADLEQRRALLAEYAVDLMRVVRPEQVGELLWRMPSTRSVGA